MSVHLLEVLCDQQQAKLRLHHALRQNLNILWALLPYTYLRSISGFPPGVVTGGQQLAFGSSRAASEFEVGRMFEESMLNVIVVTERLDTPFRRRPISRRKAGQKFLASVHDGKTQLCLDVSFKSFDLFPKGNHERL